ncbi:MAG: pyridoxamine 5'-phosphate oxidase family protein [Eubacterium sp.]|nr:pyridoxamine 5'-phosphate oxidase family protein [Eubacterium sp.]
MFRKMRRFKQQISDEECVRILKEEPRGVLAVKGEDGYPYAFPIDYIYDDGKIYFHCAKEGHKIDALKKDSRVSFCVYDHGYKKEGDWAFYINSVIIFGRIRFIEDREETIRRVRDLGRKYYPDPAEADREAVKYGDRGTVQALELTIDHMTGKLVHEK